MKIHPTGIVAVLMLGLSACSQGPNPSPAQSQAQALDNAWTEIAKWPDFMGGVWGRGAGAGGPDPAPDLPSPSLKPKVETAGKAAFARTAEAEGSRSCIPDGLPIDIGGQFFFTKGTIFLMSDLDMFVVRQIHMDRTSHGDPDPTYYGDSIGHWEGDTLVVDTVGFLPEVAIARGIPGNGATHVVERFRLTDPNRMEYKLSVSNDEVLAQPWQTTRTLDRHRDWSVQEAYCNQNNREAPLGDKPNLNLTPPK